MISLDQINVKHAREPIVAFGWGRLGSVLRQSDRAILAEYHRHTVWIAKANCAIHGGSLWAKTFAIRSAIAHNEQQEARSQLAEDQQIGINHGL